MFFETVGGGRMKEVEREGSLVIREFGKLLKIPFKPANQILCDKISYPPFTRSSFTIPFRLILY